MISGKMAATINSQINKELYSAYLYLAMSAYCSKTGFIGFANWLKVQFKEEQEHAMKFFAYVNEQGSAVELKAIQEPASDYKTIPALFEQVLSHERMVTASINEIMDLAIQEKDHATAIFLQWFVSEQVEEEAHALEIVDKMGKIGGSVQGLMMLDQHYGKRE